MLPVWAGAVAAQPESATVSAPSSPIAPADDDVSSRLGQAVHRVLEHAAGSGQGASEGRPADVDIEALAAAAAQEFGADAGEVASHAGRIWASPACERFFAGADLQWAGNEVSVSDAGEPLRIDRLVRFGAGTGATWWVLDYKLHPAPLTVAAYREQLARYRRAVQGLEPAAGVRCAFITALGEVHELA
jgi:ATP-dependent helicase/nuclease subunit A